MATRKLNPGYAWLLYGGWCLALTLLLYGAVYRLPFFFDDFVHIPFVDANSLGEIWQSAGWLAYYRPLPFTVWKLMYLMLGHHSAVLQHGFNFTLHFLNGLLVGWLAGRLWAGKGDSADPSPPTASPVKWQRTFLAASLFLLFPFSYQAVPWVGSLAHLLVTTLILLSLAAYWLMRRTGSWAWGAASLILAFMAPFAHENGVLLGPLLAVLLFTRLDSPQNVGRYLGHVLLWTLPALIWLPIWWLAPKAISGGVALGGLEAILQNTAYFTQGAAYPLTWLGGRIRTLTGANDMVVLGFLSLLALSSAAAVQLLSKADRRSLAPWLWMAVAALPALLFLEFDYVINGPRLLMLVSVGAAWLWSDVAIIAVRWARGTNGSPVGGHRARQVLIALLLLLLLAQNAAFISRRMEYHQFLGEVYRQAVSLARQANDAGQTAVLVNLPAWIAPQTTTFALGHEGVQFWPDYAPPETLVSVNDGRDAALLLANYEAIRPVMPYRYGLAGGAPDWQTFAAADGRIFVTDYTADAAHLRAVGDFALAPRQDVPLATFESPDGSARVQLVAARARRDETGLEVALTWQVETPPAEQVTAFVHVVNSEGQLAGQLDGDPMAGTFPFYQWPAGLQASEWRLGDGEAEGVTVLVGLYDRLSQERFTAIGPNGVALPDGAVPLMVE